MTMRNTVAQATQHLDDRHRRALRWFADRAWSEHAWPQPLAGGDLIVSRAKAIYKPHWCAYALSIRENIGGPYADKEPEHKSDGSWRYDYYQEGFDKDVTGYTNRALVRCIEDGVPVGVLRQTSPKPRSRYLVLGLALVTRWESGYFTLEGLAE